MKNENTTGTDPQYNTNDTIPAGSRRKTNYVPDSDKELFDFFGRHLPSAKGFFISDIDLIFRTIKNCTIVVEKKCKMAKVKTAQHITLQWLNHGFNAINNKVLPIVVNGYIKNEKFRYFGSNLLQMEGEYMDEGMYWNGQKITIKDLIQKLNFSQYDECCF